MVNTRTDCHVQIFLPQQQEAIVEVTHTSVRVNRADETRRLRTGIVVNERFRDNHLRLFENTARPNEKSWIDLKSCDTKYHGHK
jgi:hypothetical protein